MEELIRQLKSVLDAILKVRSALVVEKLKVENISQKQDEVARYQGGKEAELEKREEAVKPIEDIVVFKKAAEEMAKQVDKGRIALDEAQQKFEAYRKDTSAKLTTQRTENDKLKELYQRELEALKKAQEELKEEKAKIGTKIAESITKGLEK